MTSEAWQGRQLEPLQSEASEVRVHMFAKVASLRNSKSGVECVGLPCNSELESKLGSPSSSWDQPSEP